MAEAPGAGIVTGILGLLFRYGDGIILADDILAIPLVVAPTGFR